MEKELTVIKVGTDTLFGKDGELDLKAMNCIRDGIVAIQRVQRVLLVSSGAVARGRLALRHSSLALSRNPDDKRALSTVGQPLLLADYQRIMGQQVAQFLVNEDRFSDSSQREITRHIFAALPEGVLPIANGNDVQAKEDLTPNDNDQLAARLAIILRATRLIMLTNVDGVLNGDPNHQQTSVIQAITSAEIETIISRYCHGSSNGGTGGMASKLRAAQSAVNGGVTEVLILNGKTFSLEGPCTKVAS